MLSTTRILGTIREARVVLMGYDIVSKTSNS